jgi:hypothetical protein
MNDYTVADITIVKDIFERKIISEKNPSDEELELQQKL